MNFEEYLTSKKIDAPAFKSAEPVLFQTWQMEFDQMHVNSFTVQKLNLINPIRRKYQLKEDGSMPFKSSGEVAPTQPTSASPRVARPVYKPKIN
jgi:hypothetical protein